MVARISRTIAMRPSQTTSRVMGSTSRGAGPNLRAGGGVPALAPALTDAPRTIAHQPP